MRPMHILATLLLAGAAAAQSPSVLLVKDVNTLPNPDPSSSPYPETSHWYNVPDRYYKFANNGSTLWFEANDGTHGSELFTATTTPGSARLVKDIRPGSSSANLYYLTAVGNKVFFRADDGVNGDEPWVSDGTAAGTFMLSNYKGSADGYLYSPIAMGGHCYYFTKNAVSGYDFVKSDGTLAGTTVVTTFSDYWYYPRAVGTKIVFRRSDTATGSEPWVTDGTAAGTKLLYDIRPGTASGGCYYPITAGTKVYFWADDGTGYALWETTGTTAGTKKIGTPAGWTGTYWSDPIALGSKVIFRGRSANGYEAWVTDGTLAGTVELADAYTGSSSGYFYEPAVAGGRCYYRCYSSGKYNLYSTDGTVAGTALVRAFPTSGGPYDIAAVGAKVVFEADDATGTGDELWISDGTAAGTTLLKDIRPGSANSDPTYMTTVGSTVIFRAADPLYGTELYVTDGTPAGTVLHTNIYAVTSTGNQSAGVSYLVDVGGVTYFRASIGGVYSLWKTDGTAAGTVQVNTTPFSSLSLSASRNSVTKEAISLYNTLFFYADDGVHGTEIWMTNGTAAGTRMVKDINPGSASGYFYYPVVMGHQVYFRANDGTGYALWTADNWGNCAKVSSATTYFDYAVVLDDQRIIFGGRDATHGTEVWVSDGTAAGTRLLKDINVGSSSGYFYNPVVYNGRVYFRASDGSYGIWETDGTPAGTKKVTGATTTFSYPIVFKDKIYFHSSGLWECDGTAAGTRKLTTGTTYFYYPVVCGDRLFFRGRGTNGYELWVTDGTATGTREVMDIYTGTSSSYPIDITPNGNRFVVFEATSSGRGYEAWVSDGTAAGTFMAKDLNPGSGSGYFNYPCLSRGRLLFAGSDGNTGTELYAMKGAATVQPLLKGHPGATLQATTDPALGTTLTLQVPDVPGTRGVALVLGAQTPNPIPFAGGANMCFLVTTIYYVGVGFPPPAGGTVGFNFPIPNHPVMIGGTLAAQGFIFVTPTAPLGMDMTNGLLLGLGR